MAANNNNNNNNNNYERDLENLNFSFSFIKKPFRWLLVENRISRLSTTQMRQYYKRKQLLTNNEATNIAHKYHAENALALGTTWQQKNNTLTSLWLQNAIVDFHTSQTFAYNYHYYFVPIETIYKYKGNQVYSQNAFTLKSKFHSELI